MAEVVVEQGGSQASSGGNVFSDISDIGQWIGKYWWVILIVLIVLAGVAFLIYYLYLWDKKEKRKDPMYVHWENTLEACALNARKNWIKKKKRWWLLVFGFFTAPIFALCYLFLWKGEHWLIFWVWVVVGFTLWIPIAILAYKEFSMRFINVDQVTVGYYRGACKRMDGFVYVLLKVGRKWVVMEDNILVRIPENVLTIKTVKEKSDDTGELENSSKWDKIELESTVWNERDNYIFVPMTSLVREATYFYDVTLVQEGKILDLRQKIANSYHLTTQIQVAEQIYSQLGKVTNNAVDSNVGVVARKKEPEKQRDVNTGDKV